MPATEGYENAPAVLFQGHMDMVCVKDEGVVHDFSKDALDLYLYRDADYGVTLAARGTSLGADNGVGLAMMLTLMTTPELLHPPLEFLFTVEEESGLWGARKFDYTQIRARHMINMDSGDADMMCVQHRRRTQSFSHDLQNCTAPRHRIQRDYRRAAGRPFRQRYCQGTR